MGAEPFYHTVVLNRLGVYHPHDGLDVFYSPESFTNADAWRGMPIIYAPSDGDDISHPDFDAVTNRQLPPEFRYVGYIDYAYIPDGTQRLEATCAITDAEVEQIARDGQLAPSSAFYADRIVEGKTARIVGTITPNHLLVFRQGACPTCYSNDDGAMFLNHAQKETVPTGSPRTASAVQFRNTTEKSETVDMDETEKGWLKQLYDKICVNNTQPEKTPEEKPMTNTADNERIAALEAQIATLTNTLAERDATIAKSEEAEAQRARDAAWDQIKNTLPRGWLGEQEAETRNEFENNKDAFYVKLMAHAAKMANSKRRAEGSCGCSEEREAMLANISEVSAKTGFKIITEEE